jgi:hypothetical protein
LNKTLIKGWNKSIVDGAASPASTNTRHRLSETGGMGDSKLPPALSAETAIRSVIARQNDPIRAKI